jgi:hypothetical protein
LGSAYFDTGWVRKEKRNGEEYMYKEKAGLPRKN